MARLVDAECLLSLIDDKNVADDDAIVAAAAAGSDDKKNKKTKKSKHTATTAVLRDKCRELSLPTRCVEISSSPLSVVLFFGVVF